MNIGQKKKKNGKQTYGREQREMDPNKYSQLIFGKKSKGNY